MRLKVCSYGLTLRVKLTLDGQKICVVPGQIIDGNGMAEGGRVDGF